MNIVDYDGRTALHLAASEGHLIILKFLLYVVKVDFTIKDRFIVVYFLIYLLKLFFNFKMLF